MAHKICAYIFIISLIQIIYSNITDLFINYIVLFHVEVDTNIKL